MTREEQKEKTAFNKMLKAHAEALVKDEEPVITDEQRWAGEHFGLDPAVVRWYHSGSCYDRIGLSTKEAANRVTDLVKGGTANGGFLDGMPLGGQTEMKDPDGTTWYDVTC